MHVLIVEDEAPAARRLERMTAELLGAAATSLTIRNSLAGAEAYLGDHCVNLVLLDLNLNGADGFELLSRLAAGSFHTIVVSASVDQALRAFEYGVLDFVPKPYDRHRLAKAFDRLLAGRPAETPGMRVLSVKSMGTVRLVPVETVRFFKGADDYVELHLTNGSIELYGKSLEALCQLLPPRYCRIHKSYIVDLAAAQQIHVFGGGKYELEMRDGARLPVSRTQYQAILDKLEHPPV
jgi:DNA-binding LytR/AlgR family response regulator